VQFSFAIFFAKHKRCKHFHNAEIGSVSKISRKMTETFFQADYLLNIEKILKFVASRNFLFSYGRVKYVPSRAVYGQVNTARPISKAYVNSSEL
jgi:hypothetical protein